MSRPVVVAVLLAAAATTLRAPFVDFPVGAHPDERIIAELSLQAVRSGRLTANWSSVPGKQWSRPTYQFSPHTLAETGAALASNRLTGQPERPFQHVRFARWFSVAAGGLAVLVCFFAARAWFGDSRTTILAPLFLGVSFLHVQDSCYGRVEATLSLTVLLAVWAAGSVLNAPTAGRGVVLGLAIGLAIATKYNAVPALLFVLAPAFAGRSDSIASRFSTPVLLVFAVLAVPVGFLVATPEALADLDPLLKGIQWELSHYARGHVPHQALDSSDGNSLFWVNYLSRLGWGWAPTLAAAAYIPLAFVLRGRHLLLALFLLAAGAVLLSVKVRFERNAEILLGPACLGAAAFLTWVWNRLAWGRIGAILVGLAVGATVFQNAVALHRFRRQQHPDSSPFQQVPAWVRSVPNERLYTGYLHDADVDDWRRCDALLLAGHSDAFSQRSLAQWRERLRDGWDCQVLRTRWVEYGYPFSTVESYHGPGLLFLAKRRNPDERTSASHQVHPAKRSGPLPTSPEITVEELHRRRQAGENVRIVDVRNPDEAAICKINGAELIPLGDLPMRLATLDPDEEIVVHCKMGGRSSQAAAFLRANGFRNVRNLTGGILAWIDQIEPTLARY